MKNKKQPHSELRVRFFNFDGAALQPEWTRIPKTFTTEECHDGKTYLVTYERFHKHGSQYRGMQYRITKVEPKNSDTQF